MVDKNTLDNNTPTSDSTQAFDATALDSVVPVKKLDADQYSAEDMDGVTENMFGAGNLNYLSMQAAQTDEMLDAQATLSVDSSSTDISFGDSGQSFASSNNDYGHNNAPAPAFEHNTDTDRPIESAGDANSEANIEDSGFASTTVGALGLSEMATNNTSARNPFSASGSGGGSGNGRSDEAADSDSEASASEDDATEAQAADTSDTAQTDFTIMQQTTVGEEPTATPTTPQPEQPEVNVTVNVDNSITTVNNVFVGVTAITHAVNPVLVNVTNFFQQIIQNSQNNISADIINVANNVANTAITNVDNLLSVTNISTTVNQLNINSIVDIQLGNLDSTTIINTDITALVNIGIINLEIGVVEAVINVLDALPLETITTGITDDVTNIVDDVIDTVGDIADGAGDIITDVVDGVTGTVDNITAGTDDTVGDVVDTVGGITDGAGDIITDAADTVGGVLDSAADDLTAGTGGLFPGDGTAGGDSDVTVGADADVLGVDVVDAAVGALDPLVNPIEDIAGDVDVVADAGVDLLNGSGSDNASGDSDVTLAADGDLIDSDLVDIAQEVELDAVEAVVGDIDLDLGAGVDVLGDTADAVVDSGAGGSGGGLLAGVGDALADTVEPVTDAVLGDTNISHDGGIDLLDSSDSDNASGDSDVTVDLGLAVGGEPLPDLAIDTNLDTVETITGDIDVELDAALDLLGGTEEAIESLASVSHESDDSMAWPESTLPDSCDIFSDTSDGNDVLPEPDASISEGLGALDNLTSGDNMAALGGGLF